MFTHYRLKSYKINLDVNSHFRQRQLVIGSNHKLEEKLRTKWFQIKRANLGKVI